jgi:hypothetical protein
MKSFRDPVTHALKASGYCDTNAPGDLARDEPDDFALEPGKWALIGGEWVPVAPSPNIAINAQIAALLAEYAGNRGSLQMEVYLLEKEAREYSETYGLSMELILSGNSYYPQVKALDLQITALRALLT